MIIKTNFSFFRHNERGILELYGIYLSKHRILFIKSYVEKKLQK